MCSILPRLLCTCTILTVFLTVAIIDSIHFRSAIDTNGEQVVYDVKNKLSFWIKV